LLKSLQNFCSIYSLCKCRQEVDGALYIGVAMLKKSEKRLEIDEKHQNVLLFEEKSLFLLKIKVS
jgi:hypothetical protein